MEPKTSLRRSRHARRRLEVHCPLVVFLVGRRRGRRKFRHHLANEQVSLFALFVDPHQGRRIVRHSLQAILGVWLAQRPLGHNVLDAAGSAVPRDMVANGEDDRGSPLLDRLGRLLFGPCHVQSALADVGFGGEVGRRIHRAGVPQEVELPDLADHPPLIVLVPALRIALRAEGET